MSTTNKNAEFDSYLFWDKGDGKYSILLWNKKAKTYYEIPIMRDADATSSLHGPSSYYGKLTKDLIYKGKTYHTGNIITYSGGTLRPTFTIMEDPSAVKHFDRDTEKLYKNLYAAAVKLYNKVSGSSTSASKDNLSGKDTKKATKDTKDTGSSTSSSTTSTSSTTTTDSTTGTSSTASTDSTTTSFDFLDDVLGTQKESSKDKATELDPNQVANTIVSDTKLNDTAISSLVSTYLNSLHRINRSYNTQTK